MSAPPPAASFPDASFVASRRREANRKEVDEARKSATWGIALSGGGARSLSLSSGLLRGLHSVGVLESASHITGVSGGGWALSIYTYNQKYTQEQILLLERAGISPAQLTVEFLQEKPPASSMLHTASNMALSNLFMKWVHYLNTSFLALLHPNTALTTPLSRTWVDTIYNTFLKPVGIPWGKNLAPSAEEVEKIVTADPRYSASDFLLPAKYVKHVPSLGITLVGPPGSNDMCLRNPFSFEIPFYDMANSANIATYRTYLRKSSDAQSIEAAAIKARDAHDGVSLVSYVVTPSEVFTRYVGPPMRVSKFTGLQCVGGMGKIDDIIVMPTSVRPHEFAVGPVHCTALQCCDGKVAFPLEVVAAMGGLPIIEHYKKEASVVNTVLTRTTPSIRFRTSPGDSGSRRLLLADGGLRENTGIIALLLQGVTDILSAVNTYKPFVRELAETNPVKSIIVDISSLFGCDLSEVSFKSIYSQNAVFPLEAFDVVIRQFCAAHDAGKPLIANLRTTTIENSFYGIPAGIEVQLTMIHSYAPPSFTSQLPPEVAALSSLQPYNTAGTLPYFKTLFSNPPEPFRMNNVQANLLDVLQCWVVETESQPGGALHEFIERQKRRAI